MPASMPVPIAIMVWAPTNDPRSATATSSSVLALKPIPGNQCLGAAQHEHRRGRPVPWRLHAADGIMARMTLEQLRIFVAVAERQHVTRAAASLNLAQSAASAAIAALETQHGTKLFHRVGRGIELTE